MPDTMQNIRFPIWLILIAGLLLGILGTQWYYSKQYKPVEESTVLLEKIRTVAKMVTVEGDFSEIFTYNEYQGAMTYLFDKKMIVKVQARVSAGYDLEGLKIDANNTTRTIQIQKIPPVNILSIDHQLSYYDISEGLFVSFSPEDFNKINETAKENIRKKAQESGLLQSASNQGKKMLEVIEFMAKSAGWKVKYVQHQLPSIR